MGFLLLATQLCKDFLPCEAGVCPLQVQRCDRQSAPSPAPGGLYRGFITQAGCVIILNAIPSPPPPGGAESAKLLVVACPSPIREPTQSHLIRTKDAPATWEIPRDLGAQSQNWGVLHAPRL